MNQDNPLPALPAAYGEFKKAHPNLNLKDFIEAANNSDSDFYNYPFLRDQLFLSFFKSLKLETVSELPSFVLNAQVRYFKRYINPEFDLQTLLKSIPKVSKCPFAPRTTTTPTTRFSCESLSKVRYSIIENAHISDMPFNNLTVYIAKPGSETTNNAKFTIFTSGLHHFMDFNDPKAQFIMASDAKFTEISPMKSAEQKSETINELLKVKKVFTASDALFLFPEKVAVINPADLDVVLNIIVYFNILNFPLPLWILKYMVLSAKQLAPSALEPYEDVLSPQYIRNNTDLFQ